MSNPGRGQQSRAWSGRSWLAQVRLVLGKDLLIERKNREISTTSSFFALLVTIAASVSLQGGAEAASRVAPGVIWISVAFASILTVSKSWQREREQDAIRSLLISPLSRSALFAGKALSVLLFLFLVEALVVPSVALLFSIDLAKVWTGLVLIMMAATPGIAAAGTLFGAMMIRTKAREMVLASVLLPMQLPAILAAVSATRELVAGPGEIGDHLALLLVFDLVFVAGGLALFGELMED